MVQSHWHIEGNCYEFDECFFAYHPGGKHMLELSRGLKDCTYLFRSYHGPSRKWSSIQCMLQKYRVETCEHNDPSVDYSDTLYTELRAEVSGFFADKNLSYKCPYWLYPWYVLTSSMLGYGLYRWVTSPSILSCVLLGFGMMYASVDILHCGTHYALFQDHAKNRFLSHVLGFWFVNPTAWIRQHVIGHHVDTNLEFDPDLYHFSLWSWMPHCFQAHVPDYGVRLRSEDTSWHYASYMVHSTMVLLSTIFPSLYESLQLLLTGKYLHLDTRALYSVREHALLLSHWSICVGTLIYVSCTHHVVYAVLPYFVSGILFYLLSQVSHVNEASFPLGLETMPWSRRQILTAGGDYEYKSSLLWPIISIGLNLQAVHHLFPSVHWIWYPHLVRRVYSVAGVSMDGIDKSYWTAFQQHVHWLHVLNWSTPKADR